MGLCLFRGVVDSVSVGSSVCRRSHWQTAASHCQHSAIAWVEIKTVSNIAGISGKFVLMRGCAVEGRKNAKTPFPTVSGVISKGLHRWNWSANVKIGMNNRNDWQNRINREKILRSPRLSTSPQYLPIGDNWTVPGPGRAAKSASCAK